MKLQRVAAALSLVGCGMIGGFCALEGVSSLTLFVEKFATIETPSFNERLHTQYDPELGWVNRPNVTIADLYGPGASLSTNARGFRGRAPTTDHVAAGHVRVICSGDSFTLGYGVDDEHTWCHRLEEVDHRLETVNMGEGGYGIDQAYLWYARDGDSLEHSAHVFAIITGDFYRMQRRDFLGYGKPVLSLDRGGLVVANVPVPRSRFAFVAALRRRFDLSVGQLRSAELIRAWRKHFAPSTQAASAADAARFDPGTWEVAAKVFDTTFEMNRKHASTLLVVYLPTGDDYFTNESDPWREHLREEADRVGFRYLDLVPEFRELSLLRMRALFLSNPLGSGHYNDVGHQWVADRVDAALARSAEPRRSGVDGDRAER